MEPWYRIAANVIAVVHFAFVVFVVLGLLLILLGAVRRWNWVRNFWFRLAHLLAILFVVGQVWCGVSCPLTVWEKQLRVLAKQPSYEGDFIATWVHRLMFFSAPTWVFTLAYTLFGLAVLATFLFARPNWPSRPDSPTR